MRAAARGARYFQGRLVDLHRPHPVAEVVDHPGVESGADLAGVAQLAAFTDAEVERSEPVALVAVLPADDDEFLPLDAFDLEPVPGPLALR